MSKKMNCQFSGMKWAYREWLPNSFEGLTIDVEQKLCDAIQSKLKEGEHVTHGQHIRPILHDHAMKPAEQGCLSHESTTTILGVKCKAFTDVRARKTVLSLA